MNRNYIYYPSSLEKSTQEKTILFVHNEVIQKSINGEDREYVFKAIIDRHTPFIKRCLKYYEEGKKKFFMATPKDTPSFILDLRASACFLSIFHYYYDEIYTYKIMPCNGECTFVNVETRELSSSVTIESSISPSSRSKSNFIKRLKKRWKALSVHNERIEKYT